MAGAPRDGEREDYLHATVAELQSLRIESPYRSVIEPRRPYDGASLGLDLEAAHGARAVLLEPAIDTVWMVTVLTRKLHNQV